MNSERYRLGYEINKIQSSLKQAGSLVRLDKLKELYDEVNLLFPKILLKQYQELESFTDAISAERHNYLQANLSVLEREFIELDKSIKAKEIERSEKISLLTEADVYNKFKVYQKDLVSLESELKLLEEKLRLTDNSTTIKTQIDQLKEVRKQKIASIREAIEGRAHGEISRIFNKLITEVTSRNAIISIKLNNNGNVDFEADYQTTAQVTTSEADGASYKKLLCVAFDIALLVFYAKDSFYRFVYHDGVLEGLDDRVKSRLLNVTQDICKEYNLQYILSLIDSDIPIAENSLEKVFPADAICLNLNDQSDDGALFLRKF